MLAVFFSLCLNRSIIRLFWDYKTEEQQRKFLGTISITIIFNSLIVLSLVFIFRNIIQAIFSDINFYPYYAYAILTTFFLTFSLIPKNYYRLKNEAGKYLIISVLQLVLSIALIIWFMVINKEGAEGMLKGKMIAFFLMVPLFLYITIKHVNFSFDAKMLKQSMNFSLPIIPALIAAWAISQFDRILIAKYFTLSDVGIFSLSKRIVGLIRMLSGSFMLAYHPIFFELANSKNQFVARKKLYKYNNIYIITITLFAFLIVFFSKEFIVLLLDKRYHSAHLYIPFIALSILFTSVSSTVIGASFQQSKKMRQDMMIGVSAAVVTIIMGYLLIKPFGIYGAVAVSLTSAIFIFSCGFIYAKKNCYKVLVNWNKIIKNFLLLSIIFLIFNFFIRMDIYLSVVIKLIITFAILYYYLVKYKNELLTLSGIKNKLSTKSVK